MTIDDYGGLMWIIILWPMATLKNMWGFSVFYRCKPWALGFPESRPPLISFSTITVKRWHLGWGWECPWKHEKCEAPFDSVQLVNN